jgi:hypothetical protein
MDCKTARLLLDFFRPQAPDLAADDARDLERHLSGCPDCHALTRAERDADAALSKAMRDVAVPEGLRDRLVGRLRTDRRAANLRTLGWTARGAAVAAAVLLGGFFVWGWFQTHPPALHVGALLDEAYAQDVSPRPDWVEEWFLTRHDVRMTAPQAFDYTWLAHYGLREVQGKPVPELVFLRDGTRARVFVLSAKQFDLGKLPPDPSEFDSAGFHVEVRRDPERPDTAFLIVWTGDSLEPLLRPALPAT